MSRPATLLLLAAALAAGSGCSSGAYGRLRSEADSAALGDLHARTTRILGPPARVEVAAVEGVPVRVSCRASREAPSDRVLVFLHGVLSDHRTWRFVAGDLGRDHALLLLDLPGCGESDAPSPGDAGDGFYSPDSLARAVMLVLRDRLRANGGRPTFTLVGHSLGAMIALRATGSPGLRAEFPDVLDRIGACVLVSCVDVAMERPREEFRRIATISRPVVTIASAAGLLRPLVGRAVLEGSGDPDAALREEADRILEVLRDGPRLRAAQAMLRTAVPFDGKGRPRWEEIERLSGDYANVRVPCLLVHGSRDETLPVAMSYKLRAQLPDAKLRVVRGAMHSPQIEAPALLAGLVRDFVRSGGRGGPAILEVASSRASPGGRALSAP